MNTLKLCLISLLLMLTSLAWSQGEHASLHADFCDTYGVEQAKGSRGSCQIMIIPQVAEFRGECSGKFMGVPCRVAYYSDAAGGLVNVSCGQDQNDLFIDQALPVEVSTYRIAARVQRPRGQPSLLTDPNIYSLLNNEAIELRLAKQANSLKAEIIFKLHAGPAHFSNVQCRQIE